DLIVARHCFAHNRDPHEMLRGVTTLLDPQGHFLIENAYLLNTIENNEFDQIYHEHMFYYSIRSMQALLARHGMHIVDLLLVPVQDRKSTRLNSSHVKISYAVFCLKKKKNHINKYTARLHTVNIYLV